MIYHNYPILVNSFVYMKNRTPILLGILPILAAVGIAVWYTQGSAAYAQPIGILVTEPNGVLKANAESYMETATESRCSSILYGYDDRYAYTWMYCGQYEGSIGEDPVRLVAATSTPTRFEYRQPDFDVIGFEEPGDGNLYESALKALFPKEMFAMGHPTNDEIELLKARALQKAKAYARPNGLSSFVDDLDGDGAFDDTVTLLVSESPELGRSATLRINDSVVVVPGGNPSGTFTAVDLNTRDSYKEIAVYDEGPSSDPTTSFYLYNGKSITLMATTPGAVEQMTFDGNGGMTTLARAQTLDTWFYRDTYQLQDDHTLARIPREFYEREQPTGDVIVRNDIATRKSPTDATTVFTLQKGAIATILGCDEIAWCKIENANKETGWFSIKESGAFDGLSFAD